MEGFSPASPPRIFWNSRKRSAGGRSLENALKEESLKTPTNQSEESRKMDTAPPPTSDDDPKEETTKSTLSERRRALFEPLEPTKGGTNGCRTTAEVLLPPPDFDSTSYPKGWLVGKKRKLVNVDVVESMRRIAIQEMNRKDREINGLNEQLEEDARCLEHLQIQLLQERSKRAEVERENAVLQDQISMLMNVLDETQDVAEEAAPMNP
ncbi:protein HEADING DATE REPRESSOR 1 [Elaeis guineensis]|uniref:Protein HEADING DATE REPRESSOR 1 n=1 Tax=Elaeis guineensis var. tenera TaxID=51953 RepID=A0A6I9QLZ6_ELAGV|nr:protein HEADING DATE REPRESSOR 1 [Elaeis guineensis]